METHKEYALKRLIEGASANQISKEIPVHRSTITRWIKNDPDFAAALHEDIDASKGLTRLVPDAIKVLEAGLQGKKTASQTRVALDIIKAAAQIGKLSGSGNESDFMKRLQELDAGNNGQPD